MRLVTSCPNCEAAFYVVPEQLAAHRGDVRCGQCEQVFNALDRLAEVPDHQPLDQGAETEQAIVFEPSEPEATSIPEIEDPLIIDPATEIAIIDEQELHETSDVEENEDQYRSVEETDLQSRPVQPENIDDSGVEQDTLSKPAFNIADFKVAPETNILSPSMIDDATRGKAANTGKQGVIRLIQILVVLLLIALAIGQAAYLLRSEIAARWPQSRPYLDQTCVWLQCQVRLPENVDLIMIDDSDLIEDTEREGLIHLYAALINQAEHSQEFPLLQLTLTDAHDKPLLRRTFDPKEYLSENADLKAGFSAKSRIEIRLPLLVEDQAITGYRLFVTY